ncbi:MAG: bifunctional phosphopantothenoylcysteine decarboxylase/phosphopantothenate--cysteine ligase CoaBC [Eubacteriales bacterium]
MKKKTVLLGVTGSIAAYKMANVASSLVKMGIDVHVILTKNGAEFITPTTFETITSNKCLVDTFDRDFQFDVTHISLAKRADILLIAPATANIIGKLAHGIADDMLSTTAMACTCKKIFAPAMNTNMYQNNVVQKNMALLEEYGYDKISPASGRLACGDVGEGKLPSEEVILSYLVDHLQEKQDLFGKKVLVTAGATQEKLDPVRYLTNHSTGKMGYALAKVAKKRGAEVVLLSGKTNLPAPEGVEFVSVVSAEEMFQAVKAVEDWDIVIKAAAVADYRPVSIATEKMKKTGDNLTLSLERTTDILAYLGAHRKEGQIICGFAMETENLMANSREKLLKKNVDMIVANNLKEQGAGFGVDSNLVTILSPTEEKTLPLLSKEEVAEEIFNEIVQHQNFKKNK